MRIRTIRHFILYFAVGLSWGLMAKTFASTYLYIGYDDPQVVESLDAYEIERLLDPDSRSEGTDLIPETTLTPEESLEGIESEDGPRGTISI